MTRNVEPIAMPEDASDGTTAAADTTSGTSSHVPADDGLAMSEGDGEVRMRRGRLHLQMDALLDQHLSNAQDTFASSDYHGELVQHSTLTLDAGSDSPKPAESQAADDVKCAPGDDRQETLLDQVRMRARRFSSLFAVQVRTRQDTHESFQSPTRNI